ADVAHIKMRDLELVAVTPRLAHDGDIDAGRAQRLDAFNRQKTGLAQVAVGRRVEAASEDALAQRRELVELPGAHIALQGAIAAIAPAVVVVAAAQAIAEHFVVEV